MKDAVIIQNISEWAYGEIPPMSDEEFYGYAKAQEDVRNILEGK